ncbi:acyltransferase [Paenibacillus soyae]|uniref:Acyltransferase n=1 Tax=Paenibacillus soyae TaxID=2969249 RepID=A0A9X2MVM5_9BACL|nr:acyltransferase [Paenibacillus soyae]MCR2807896.1 acyltransferase [Paenibacillus soyae]
MNNPLTAGANGSRISEIDLVRAFAMIGVLAVHATSFATLEMLDDPASYPVYNFLNIFMKFGTPVFLFLSSFVLFMSYYAKPLSAGTFVSFYRKRLIHIIIPYLVFSTIYYIAVAVTRTEAERPASLVVDFVNKLANGTAYSHLYFVFVSAQFYVLFPLALWLLKKLPRLIPFCIPIGFAVQWGFYALGQRLDIEHASSWAFTYFSFYMLGVYMGIRFPAWRDRLRSPGKGPLTAYRVLSVLIWTGWLAGGILHSRIWYDLRTGLETLPLYVYSLYWNIYAFVSALVFLQAAFHLGRRFGDAFLIRKLKAFGAMSLGIYLLHPLLLAVYRELKPGAASMPMLHLWYAGGFLLALLGSALIVWLSHRYLPFAWLLFGKNEIGGHNRRIGSPGSGARLDRV